MLTGNSIYYVSSDAGRSWQLQPPFHDARFFSYAHRLRTLRDGTMVLAVPFSPGYGPGQERPTRMARDLAADTEMQMSLYFSKDQGRSWNGPLMLFGGLAVSETDFVELPSGDLLFVNWLPPRRGRQIVYRSASGWHPGPAEHFGAGVAPETVALTPQGILVGCLRPGSYYWSDDGAKSWHKLDGIPNRGPECYQPWIQVLPDGRIACAGHYGSDDPFGRNNHYVSMHLFQLEVSGHRAATRLSLSRDFDEAGREWRNSFRLSLTSNGSPLAGQELEVWYVERDQPGYDSYADLSLAERMRRGGQRMALRTDAAGNAALALPQFDRLSREHHTIQIAARFNAERRVPGFLPAETFLYEFYTWIR